MNPPTARRWLHRFAWLTAILTLLLPVTTGAVVTTLKAGMAFGDWPSSDGYNMLAYPWLSSARDQFVEHGHRLSGLTIGLLSVALVGFAWTVACGRAAKYIATAIFAAVLIQGVLGGARVLLDKETLALIHGDFAAGVFSLMSVFVMVTSPRWGEMGKGGTAISSPLPLVVASVTLVLIVTQYFFGGVLRHMKIGWAWWLHPWFALVPLVASMVFVIVAKNAGSPRIVRFAWGLCGLVISQSVLGLATWFVRYGVPSWGVVAQQESLAQVVICSLHKVVGMLTLMTAVLSVVFVCSVSSPVNQRKIYESGKLDGSMMGAAT